MKHLNFLSLCGIVAMAVSLFTLTACGGDDDDSPKPNGQEQTNNNGNNNGNNGNNGTDINYAYLDGTWALVHKKGKDAEHDYDKDFPTADNDGYEELVFGSTNTVEHWKQTGEQWICDVSGAYTRTGDVITLGEMTIHVMMLTKDELVLDMGDEIITARKIELEGVWALVHKKGKDAEHNYDEDFPTAGNNGYEELVFGPANTVQHWAQKKGQWSCDVEGTYTRTGDVITLREMNITILKLKLTNLVLDMGNEIITARKLTQSAYNK